jgi:hypothetical protein
MIVKLIGFLCNSVIKRLFSIAVFPHRVKFFKATCTFDWVNNKDLSNRTPYPSLRVHPVPAPVSTKAELSNSNILAGRSQKLILFNRGNAISGLPIITGTNMFPNPPIRAGITMKNIINRAWAVITSRGQYVCNLLRPQTLPSEPYVIVSHHTARRAKGAYF